MRIAVLLALSSLFATASKPESSYPDLLSRIDARRAHLDERYHAAKNARTRAAVLASARTVAFSSITEDILPAWNGTRWDFYGTSEEPGEGAIACGYLVTTVLRDAGFHVERVRLAQQASEKIVKSLAPGDEILRFRGKTPAEVVDGVRAKEGDGLYVIGFDYHVGLLVIDGDRADLCHAAWYAAAGCEPAASAQGMMSSYHVVGPVLTDARVTDWLEGNAIPTQKR